MKYVQCGSCGKEMTGIRSPAARSKCDKCGGKALLAIGEDITPAERDEVFAYHDRIRHLYTRGAPRTQ